MGTSVDMPPVRLTLTATRRAGLHIVCDLLMAGGEARYVANVALRRAGVVAIAPCSLATCAAWLDEIDDGAERDYLRALLRGVYGADPAALGLRSGGARDSEDDALCIRAYLGSLLARRLFALAEGIALDAAGNARSGTVRYLDRTGRGSGCPDGDYGGPGIGQGYEWLLWKPGQTIYWHPFRLTLRNTRRAGLHIVALWRDPKDGEIRYGTTIPVRHDGILALAPANAAEPVRPLADAMALPGEEAILNDNLRIFYRWGCGTLGRPVRFLHGLPRSVAPAGWLGDPDPDPRASGDGGRQAA